MSHSTICQEQWFSTLDLCLGYWQVELDSEDKPKTAFVRKRGMYQFKVMLLACAMHLPLLKGGGAFVWWLTPRTLDPDVRGSSPTRSPCFVLEQDIFTPTPKKVLVIPRKRWLHPNMTEKLFTGTLSIKPNQTKTFERLIETIRATMGHLSDLP